jgi:hypothetical protein
MRRLPAEKIIVEPETDLARPQHIKAPSTTHDSDRLIPDLSSAEPIIWGSP